MNQWRLAPALYFAATVLFVIPLFDAAVSVAPWHPTVNQWRFAIVGLLSNALLLPMLGALLFVVTAVTQGHERFQVILRYALLVMVVGMVGIIAAFTLDLLQARAQIRPEGMYAFTIATSTAVVKLIMATMSLFMMARACAKRQEVVAGGARQGGVFR